MNKEIYSLLEGVLGKDAVLADEPMKNHTSFKIGGNADFLVLPKSDEQIAETVRLLKENNIRFTVIGNGSNLLVDDDGIRGVVIKLGKNFSAVRCSENVITAQSGALLSRVSSVAYENSLTGLEFAAGIPGTVGGAAVMNAGAYGGEMKDVIVKSVYLNGDGEICTYTGDEHKFGYRKSAFTSDDIVLEVTFSLTSGDRKSIGDKMAELNRSRREKQPLELPSAGSAFKRPEGYFAGKLIQDAGLKGFKIGGASVSEKHSGFIVNDGTATCADVLLLTEHIQKTVFERFSVMLEPEIRYIK